MCVLHGDDFTMPKREKMISGLSSVIFYMNFSGIFDRNGAQKKIRSPSAEGEGPVLARGYRSGLRRRGATLSGGVGVDGVGIDKPGGVIVIENEKRIARQTKVVTVDDDGTQNSTRKYHREERREDIEVLYFDGEGLIPKE